MAKKTVSAEARGLLENHPGLGFFTAPASTLAETAVGAAARAADGDDALDLKLYTLKELEALLGVSTKTLLDYIKHGRLKAVKIGVTWRVTRRNLLAFVNGE